MTQLFNRSVQLKRSCRHSQTTDPLHQLLADLIKDRLAYVLRDFTRALIIGDLDLEFTGASVFRIPQDIYATSDFLPFGEATFDLVISYMDLHHANDIPGILKQINYTLKPDGLFLGCFLGGRPCGNYDRLPKRLSFLSAKDVALALPP